MVFIANVGDLIFGVANMGYNQAKANRTPSTSSIRSPPSNKRYT